MRFGSGLRFMRSISFHRQYHFIGNIISSARFKSPSFASVYIPLPVAKVAAEKQKRIRLFSFQAQARKSSNNHTTRRCTRPPTALRFARSSLRLPAAGELSRCVAAPADVEL